MITNLWERVHLLCGNHNAEDAKDLPHMTPHKAADSATSRGLYGNNMKMFYACPKYYPSEREEGEPACRNHISMKEFENMLDVISKEIEKANRNDMMVDLVGMKWKSKAGTEFRVVRYGEDRVDVVCVNKKSLWK